MSWDGNIDRIGQLADRIGDLARVPSRASGAVAERLSGLLADEFDHGHDSYGDPWAPLAPATLDKGRSPPPLTDTRRLRDGLRVRPARPAGVAVTIDAPYAAPHQTGWSGPQGDGPARPILPDREMPAEWADAIEEETARAFKRAVAL